LWLKGRGWRKLPGTEGGGEEQRAEEVLPPNLAKGQPQDVIDIKAVKKSTRPPKRFTEGTLLTAMETAGRTLEERELSAGGYDAKERSPEMASSPVPNQRRDMTCRREIWFGDVQLIQVGFRRSYSVCSDRDTSRT